MSDIAIQADNISKRYRIGKLLEAHDGSRSLKRRLASSFDYLRSTLREPDEAETLWALKDISFKVSRGEVVGIIGPNGAGKSTLLKILSRITEPTSGRAVINGRVGSLLEVGTGFHPQLTGRENIYLSGAVLGMKRAEIDKKFDEIIAFSEVERFLDTQVKRYSSGMYVRLAFSVAAYLQPEVLIVDEVLAVGDAAFQRKCLGKMGEVAQEGRTVLFVSHNMIAIQNLCGRTIWLDQGEILEQGNSSDVVSKYLSKAHSAMTEQQWDEPDSAPGNDLVRIHRVRLSTDDNSPNGTITTETALVLEVEFWNMVEGNNLHVSLNLLSEQEIVVFTTSSIDQDPLARERTLKRGLYRSRCHVPANLLNSGGHRVRLNVHRDTRKIIYRLEEALAFQVLDLSERTGTRYHRELGVVRPMLDWSTEHVE